MSESIIYNPSAPIWNVKFADGINGAAKNAGMAFIADWAAGIQQPWAYYAGFGAAALVAGVGTPGAAMTFYVVGDLLDMYVLKSEDGAQLRFFLNGVASYTTSTLSGAIVWELVQLAIEDASKPVRVDVVAERDPAHPQYDTYAMSAGFGFPWTVTSTRPETAPPRVMGAGLDKSDSVWAITYTFQDAKKKKAKTKLYYPGAATFEEAQAYALAIRDAYVGGLGLVQGAILDISISQEARLPDGIKAAPRSAADVEEQMRFTLQTDDRKRSTTHSVPTWDAAYTQLLTNAKGDYERHLPTVPLTTQYVNHLLGGGGFPSVENNRGESLAHLKKARGSWTT
jgi:hypothetical protein